MAVAQEPFLAAVLLLVSLGLHCSSPLPACPESCSCQRAPLLNCSSSGLSLVPQRIQDSVRELDLSHNLLDSVTLDRPRHNLRNVWLGNNNITHLSLCIERNLGSHNVRGRHLHRLRPWSRRRCVSWAPTLQLLSVERNQLELLPEGLEGSELLQVLQLSFNRISSLRPEDLTHLRQLKELHLQHNLITSLHPQMFQDLAQLQVLDLSFNMLTSLHPSMYLSLRNIGAAVRLDGNRWQCDCSMRSLRRWMAYGSSRGLQTWSVECASPSLLSGRDLLQLEEDDLNCFSTENRPEFHRDVTVYSGSEILLSCSTQDSTWWTPSGPASVSQPQAGLLISDITERDTGLYVCVSEEHEVVSVFNLQISKIEGARRKIRSLPGTGRQIIPQDIPKRIGQERNLRATQCNLTLAVCLSVFITFLIAFILGVLTRPCIDVLWRRVTKKKSSSATNSASCEGQRQYDNEAYSSGEEPQEIGTHRERRVTFSTVDLREDNNVQYYDTVVSDNQESINNDAMIECEAAEAGKDAYTAGDSGSENSLRQSSPDSEHIPDHVEVEKRRSLSSCSDSSLSDKEFNVHQMTHRDHTTPKSPQMAKDSVQQRTDFSTARKAEVPQSSIEDSSEMSGFSSEPFTDWSPHTNNTKVTDPDLWQENEEQFEFSDSVRSTSARSSSLFGSFNGSKLIVAPTSDKQKRSESSSSSNVSEDEPTKYNGNLDQGEGDMERNHKPEVTNDSLQQQIHSVELIRPSVGFNQSDYRYDTQRPAVNPDQSSSSHSSDSDGEDYKVKQETDKGERKDQSICVSDKLSSRIVTGEWDTRENVKPMPPTKWRVPSLSASSPPAAYSSSSSSESEAEITDLKVEHNTGRVNEGIKINEPETLSTDLDCQGIPQIKRSLDINTPVPTPDSSSSDESTDDTTKHSKKQEKRDVDMAGLRIKEYQSVSHNVMKPQCPVLELGHVTPIKRCVDIRAPSPPTDSSSSSDSEDETTGHTKKARPGKVDIAGSAFQKPQTISHDPQTQWPALDLDHTVRIKRRLDIKTPSLASDSSCSSDSENEKTHHTERPGKVDIERLPFQKSQTVSHDPVTKWPTLDLGHIPRIKRRLDIKAPSPPPDSFSNGEIVEEKITQIKKREQGEAHVSRLPFQESQAESHDPETRWPVLDLEHTTRIKRRLDIKASSPPSNSSSSSDSEGETANHIKKQEKGESHMARLPMKVSKTISHDPQTQWPALDLDHTTRIKRRLDIKASSPPSNSSSSSDSEDETIHHIERPGKMDIAGLPFQESQAESHDPETQWPVLDLEHTTRIKRRLDIKASSPPSNSSSSSDSEGETANHIKKQEKGESHMARLPMKVSKTISHDPQTQWPALDLDHTTRIKRRLDIKASSPPSNSSSSSNSEDETTTNHIKKQEKGDTHMARLPMKVSQTISYDPQTQWPAVDLEHIPRIKRRLDIKAPSPPTDSSSSSDSEDETATHIKKQEQGQMHMARLPMKVSQTISHDPQTQWPALDLDHTTSIKRRLDIETPSLASDSSSSSDSEDETTHHIERPGKMDIAGLPFQKSQTVSHDPDTRWPALDLGHIPRIKRRLDIKAPSPPPDSSSNGEIVEEKITQIKKHEQGEVHVSRLPFQESQAESHDPETRWPVLDLEHTTRIKRRLDIKASSPPSNSSSSSDSEGETANHIKKQEKGESHMARLPMKVSKTISHDPQTQWPALDLDHTTRIKRRLDIKASSPPSNSSSSSDSEDETTTNHINKQEKGDTHMARLPMKVSQTISYDPQTQWPAVDLEHIPRIKRRLDIKAPSPPTDSSSSSDSEDETATHIKKQEQGQMHMARLPMKVSQTISHDPQTQWPALDLDHTTSIKRRLDIETPSLASDSSSSSDSEDETTHHAERPGKVDIARLPFQKSQTVSHDPDTRWPALDLGHIPRIKRRLDIKAPSPPPDSSSNGEIVEEKITQIKKREQGEVHVSRLPFQESQAESHDPETRWPVLDLEHTTRIKRRLDIGASSPPSNSSSSSDSEDETTNHIRKQEKGESHMARFPMKVSQTISHDPQTQWPTLDLEHNMHIERRLDIKAPSPASDSSSSNDSEDETIQHTKKERLGVVGIAGLPFQESQTVSHNLEKQWPAVDLGNITHMKRRLDIKTPLPPPNSLLSGGSTNHTVREKAMKMNPRGSSSSSDEPENGMEDSSTTRADSRWPELDLSSAPHVKRRLDIKARSPPPESSSSSSSNSDNESSLSSQTVKHERGNGDVGITNHEQQTKLHKRSPGVPYINRRLDNKAPSPQPDLIPSSVSPSSQQSESSSSRSASEDENRDHTKLGLGVSATSKATVKEVISSPKTPGINISRSPKTDHNIKLEKYTIITDDVGLKTTSDNTCTTPEINPELESRWATMNLGISRFRKRLEITSHQREPPNLLSSPATYLPSSSSSESGTGYKSSRTRQNRREVGMQGITEKYPSTENKPVNVSLSLKGRDNNSGNSIEAKEGLSKYSSFPTTEEKSNPDAMLTGHGTPHFRRSLDIKVSEKAAAAPPLQQLSDSSSSSENEDASTEHEGKGWRGRYQPPAVADKEASQNHTSKSDIRATLEREASASSNSDNETIDHIVPDLSLGVPRIKRRLNVKVQLPELSNSSSSCSESENEVTGYIVKQRRHASNMTRIPDNDSPITYKRVIMKTSMPPSNSFPSSGQTIDHLKQRQEGAEIVTVVDGQEGPSHSMGDRNASLAPRNVPSVSFDEIVKKRIEQSIRTTDVDLSPKIRWTGIGHQLSDLSISSPRRHLDVGFSSPQQAAPAELPPPDSSNSLSSKSVDGIKHDRGKADVTLLHKYSSLSASSVYLASSRAPDKLDNSSGGTNENLRAVSEVRRERKGLSALKAMSSERQIWDTQHENIDKGESLVFDGHGLQVDTSFKYRRYEEDIKPLAKQPITQLRLSSISVDERRATDLLSGIPHYRKHDFGGTEPPQEAPLPIPATPSPDEAVGLTWRSPQSRNTEESDPSLLVSQNLAVYFESSNIHISDV